MNSRRRSSRVAVLAALASLALAVATAADASLPGRNGKIAFSADGGDIWTVNADRTRLTQVTFSGGNYGDGDITNGEPAWSPTGDKIAFIREWHSSTDASWSSDVYVMNSDGSGVKRMTTSSAAETNVSWSPDSAQLAFARAGPGGGIYLMTANGRSVKRIKESRVGDRDVEWFPDGRRIVFSGRVGSLSYERALFTIRPGGTGRTRIAHSRLLEERRPSVSPDGTRIAFDVGGIWVMNANGSDRRLLRANEYDDPIDHHDPAWSPQGDKISYQSITDASWLSVMNPDGTGVRDVVGDAREGDWQPICEFVGTAGADVIHGTPGQDLVCAGGGNDTIYGYGGNDVIFAGSDSDRVFGGDGNDVVNLGPGADIGRGGPGGDRFWARHGDTDTVDGGPGNDVCIAEPADSRAACP